MSFKDCAPLAALIALGLLTAACGNNPTDRALTGGAIGAGTGAVVGSTVGAPIAGAVVGGLRRRGDRRGDHADSRDY